MAGGLAPKLLPRLRDVLVKSYLRDSLMHDLIASFPLHVVKNEFVGVLGALVRAHRLLTE